MSGNIFSSVLELAGTALFGPIGGQIGSMLGGFIDQAIQGSSSSSISDSGLPDFAKNLFQGNYAAGFNFGLNG